MNNTFIILSLNNALQISESNKNLNKKKSIVIDNNVGISKTITAKVQKKKSPLENAYDFLSDSCNFLHCFQLKCSSSYDMSNQHKIPSPEIFSSKLILDLLVDSKIDEKIISHLKKYIKTQQKDGMFWFFEDKNLIPSDVDCVAIGLSVLHKANLANLNGGAEKSAIDNIISNTQQDGIIQVYFPPRGHRETRLDSVVCANALCLLHLARRGSEMQKTEDFVYRVLEKREYLKGTRYYPAPEAFLYFLSRAIKTSKHLQKRFLPLLQKRLKELIDHHHADHNPLHLALRIIAANNVYITNHRELEELCALQKKNGSWDACCLGTTGQDAKKIYFGSEALTTAFAAKALLSEPMISNDSDIKPLEYSFTQVIQDEKICEGVEKFLKQWLKKQKISGDDLKKLNYALYYSIVYIKYTCPANSDRDSLIIAMLYGMSILIHGGSIFKGKNLDVPPEQYVNYILENNKDTSKKKKSLTSILLTELGKRLKNKKIKSDTMYSFVHYARLTYDAILEKHLELHSDTKYNDGGNSLKKYEENRLHRIAVIPWIWLFITLNDYQLPIKFGHHEDIQNIIRLTSEIIYIRNDIETMNKDEHDLHRMDNYIFLIEKIMSCDREKAIAITKHTCNQKIMEMVKLEKRILSEERYFPKDSIKFLNFLKSLMIGNLLTLDELKSTSYVKRDTLA